MADDIATMVREWREQAAYFKRLADAVERAVDGVPKRGGLRGTHKRGMSDKQRKALSRRMKKMWREKRKLNAKQKGRV